MRRSPLLNANTDPALRRKLVGLRVVFLLVAVGVTILMTLGALSGELSNVSGRSTRAVRPTLWEDSPVLFVIRFTVNLLLGLGAMALFYLLFEGFIRRTHGWPISAWWTRDRTDDSRPR